MVKNVKILCYTVWVCKVQNWMCVYRIAQNFGGGIFWPATAKNLPSKVFTLNNSANSMTTQLLKYHHPNVFSNFICQKLAPPKYCTIRQDLFVNPDQITLSQSHKSASIYKTQ